MFGTHFRRCVASQRVAQALGDNLSASIYVTLKCLDIKPDVRIKPSFDVNV